MTDVVASIRCVKGGEQYRVRTATGSYLLALDREQGAVFVYSADWCHGGYVLSRFGGALSPTSIREFLRAERAGDAPRPSPMSIVESEEESDQ